MQQIAPEALPNFVTRSEIKGRTSPVPGLGSVFSRAMEPCCLADLSVTIQGGFSLRFACPPSRWGS